MSTVESKLEHLRQEISAQIASFDLRRKDNKKKAFAIRIGIIASGTATTVILGLSFPGYEQTAKNVALVLSAVATLLSAWENYFNHRQLWIRYTATSSNLKRLLSDLNYISLSESVSEKGIDSVFKRFQSELIETNQEWQVMRQRSDSAQDNSQDIGQSGTLVVGRQQTERQNADH